MTHQVAKNNAEPITGQRVYQAVKHVVDEALQLHLQKVLITVKSKETGELRQVKVWSVQGSGQFDMVGRRFDSKQMFIARYRDEVTTYMFRKLRILRSIREQAAALLRGVGCVVDVGLTHRVNTASTQHVECARCEQEYDLFQCGEVVLCGYCRYCLRHGVPPVIVKALRKADARYAGSPDLQERYTDDACSMAVSDNDWQRSAVKITGQAHYDALRAFENELEPVKVGHED